MPGATPVLGLPYPYQTDPITVADFANLANAIDVAMTAQSVSAAYQLNGRPVAKVRVAGGQTSPSGTLLTLNWDITAPNITDNSGMFNPAVPDRLTATVAGMYLVSAHDHTVISGFATMDVIEVLVNVNGAYQAGERGPGFSGATQAPVESCTTFVPMGVGDALQVQVNWTGTGGPATWQPQAFLSCSYICPFT